jgi:hypothetical protein
MSTKITLQKDNKQTMVLDLMELSGFVKTKVREAEKKHALKIRDKYKQVVSDGEALTERLMPSEVMSLMRNQAILGLTQKANEGASPEDVKQEMMETENTPILHEMQKIFEKIQAEIEAELEDTKLYAICQALIDVDVLNDENRELIESDVEGEFWQKQSIKEVQKAFDYFRGKRM